eukprot:7970755-Pyramimonas_sp.AAC.1
MGASMPLGCPWQLPRREPHRRRNIKPDGGRRGGETLRDDKAMTDGQGKGENGMGCARGAGGAEGRGSEMDERIMAKKLNYETEEGVRLV